jgi:hypothetical protein
MDVRAKQVVVTSRAPVARATEALDRLPRWTARDGVQGRRRDDRLTLTLASPRRGFFVPVLKARLDQDGGHLVALGVIRPMRVGMVPLLLPLLFVGSALFAHGNGRRVLLTLGLLFAAGLALMARAEARDYPALVDELERQLQGILNSRAAPER